MKGMLAAVLLSTGMFLYGAAVFADDTKFELNPQFGIRELLQVQTGKRLSVRTDSGETLEGTVTKVGDHLLHISKLSGKDFYDAVVRIDRITSVVLKVR